MCYATASIVALCDQPPRPGSTKVMRDLGCGQLDAFDAARGIDLANHVCCEHCLESLAKYIVYFWVVQFFSFSFFFFFFGKRLLYARKCRIPRGRSCFLGIGASMISFCGNIVRAQG
jgi:hypothetical protein